MPPESSSLSLRASVYFKITYNRIDMFNVFQSGSVIIREKNCTYSLKILYLAPPIFILKLKILIFSKE